MANEAIPFYEDGDELTCKAAAALIGKRLVTISAARAGGGPELVTTGLGGTPVVNYPSAGGVWIGVTQRDVASGDFVTVCREGVWPINSAATMTAGTEVQANATGQVVAFTTGRRVGILIDDCASGDDAQVLLYGAPV